MHAWAGSSRAHSPNRESSNRVRDDDSAHALPAWHQLARHERTCVTPRALPPERKRTGEPRLCTTEDLTPSSPHGAWRMLPGTAAAKGLELPVLAN
jgi:hypothetical protein